VRGIGPDLLESSGFHLSDYFIGLFGGRGALGPEWNLIAVLHDGPDRSHSYTAKQ
ncbi:unnamed protein product, partial [Amoebophrya sp. A25]